MRLFLCSNFERVGSLIKDEILGKKVVFIPTASIYEEYRAYVDCARKLFENFGAKILDLEIFSASCDEIKNSILNADIIYFSGGNTFFLIDQIKKKGVDKLIEKHINCGKLYIGESAGAMVCGYEILSIDEVPKNFSQKDFSGLSFVDFSIVPHYLCEPFYESSKKAVEQFSNFKLFAITNDEAILVDGKNIEKLMVK